MINVLIKFWQKRNKINTKHLDYDTNDTCFPFWNADVEIYVFRTQDKTKHTYNPHDPLICQSPRSDTTNKEFIQRVEESLQISGREFRQVILL